MSKAILHKYFNLSPYESEKMIQLIDIYSFWNQKVNLISRKDFQYFYERHVLHSLAICKVFSFKPKTQIMDLGTGGGFPGIPLAIMFPNVNFYLVDSISKKIEVVKKIVNDLELKNVVVINDRAENINMKFDFVICRAVATLDKLSRWSITKLSNKHNHDFKNGLICLKGGDLNQEKNHIKSTVIEYLISEFFEEDFFLEKKIVYLAK
jgi:16S rRNA (guanine527-N7)-methyltransferase